MKFLSALQPYLVNIYAFLGGSIFGLFAGADLVGAAELKKSAWEILNSTFVSGIVGGIFTAIITGTATYIATKIVTNIPRKNALQYKINVYKNINNILLDIRRDYLIEQQAIVFSEIVILKEFEKIYKYMQQDVFSDPNSRVHPIEMEIFICIDDRIKKYITTFENAADAIYDRIENVDCRSERVFAFKKLDKIIRCNEEDISKLESYL